jgi:hydroxymethylpyrimidine pyrophosphatase-like HAD family hydrolase
MLVTGRELPDLLKSFAHTGLFARIVAENGALLYRPADKDERVMAPPPPESLVKLLGRRGVAPLSVGLGILSTSQANENTLRQAIRELGLDLEIIFNKGGAMVLPRGINKGSVLAAALGELGLEPQNVVAVGDAENDQHFLDLCSCAVAVANALPALKERADFVTRGAFGAGVRELADELIANDLAARKK